MTSTIYDHSSDYLAKLINDEYEAILVVERANLPRAKAIGEKLWVLRARVTHGEWQSKLRGWCPQISYETATKYIRVYRYWPEIEKRAAAKDVVTTGLTIDAALKLLAKPPKTAETGGAQANATSSDADTGDTDADTNTDSSDGEDDDGSEDDDAADSEDDDGWLPEVRLKAYSPADLVTLLGRIHDTEYLTALAAELMKVLRPTASASATASEVSVRRM
jgi:hypothetical protein